MSRFNDAFDIVIGHEGGYTADPRDRGNWTDGAFGQRGGKLLGTKYGIAAHVYPHLDIPNLTINDACQIYKTNYWDRAGCDNLPDDLALCVFDTAVNSGVGRALQLLTAHRTVDDYLSARLAFLRGLGSWATFGRGWTKRVEQLRAQAHSWGAHSATPAAPALPATRQLYTLLRNPDGTPRPDAISITVDAQGRVMLGADNKPRAYYMDAATATARGVK